MNADEKLTQEANNEKASDVSWRNPAYRRCRAGVGAAVFVVDRFCHEGADDHDRQFFVIFFADDDEAGPFADGISPYGADTAQFQHAEHVSHVPEFAKHNAASQHLRPTDWCRVAEASNAAAEEEVIAAPFANLTAFRSLPFPS
jgi:hypothetical protein